MRIREEEMRMGLKMISEILNVPAFPRKHRQVLEILPGLPRRHTSRRHIAQFRVVHICKLESNLSLLRFVPIRHKNNHVSLQTLYNQIIFAYIYSHPFAHPVPYHSKCIIRSSFPLTSHFFYIVFACPTRGCAMFGLLVTMQEVIHKSVAYL